MKLTKLANLIYGVLEGSEEARNDDNVLIFEVWNRLTPTDRNIWEIPMGDFFFILKDKWRLPNESTIRRTRRKVQEHYSETRGSKYYSRKSRSQDIKSNLKLIAAVPSNPSY